MGSNCLALKEANSKSRRARLALLGGFQKGVQSLAYHTVDGLNSTLTVKAKTMSLAQTQVSACDFSQGR